MKPMGYLLLMFFLFISSSSASQNQDPIPVYESFSIESKQVVETRTINVWTPPGYLTNVDSFTVLYMADGGMKEDFPHIANTIAELVKSKKIPPVILVGIENTQRRRDLTGPTEIKEDKKIAPVVGGAEKFRAFIKEELFFEVNKRYRTTNKRGIIGESLAGLFVVETFLYNPDMFSYYIAMDPSLWWNNHYLVRTAKDHLSKLSAGEKRFWFAGSSVTDISLHTKELDNILKSENRLNLKWNYSDEPKEKHHTIFRATKEKALIWTFNINKTDR